MRDSHNNTTVGALNFGKNMEFRLGIFSAPTLCRSAGVTLLYRVILGGKFPKMS